jgi:hypothetical protein
MKLYRYTSEGEGIYTIGKRLLPENLVSEANEARKWLPKPQFPQGEYKFYLTQMGKEQYEKTLLKVHKKYLKDIEYEEIEFSDLDKIFFQDEWQVVIKK